MELNVKVSHSRVVIILGVCVGLILAFMLLQFHGYDEVKAYTLPNSLENGEVSACIDTIQYDSYLNISGWALVRGEDISTVNSYFILRNIDTNQYIQILTVEYERPELTSHFNDGKKYINAGLKGKVKQAKLHLEKNTYEVCIAYGNNGHRIFCRTGKIISLANAEKKG